MLSIFTQPRRSYLIIGVISTLLVVDIFFPDLRFLLVTVAGAAALQTLWNGLKSVAHGKISIDTFNAFAVVLSFFVGDARSAAFIVLMLTFASVLDWHTEERAHRAVEMLLKNKPLTARVEALGEISDVRVEDVAVGSTVVVESGARVPCDGIVLYGEAHLNEATITGESTLIKKNVGDMVLSGSINESGIIKVRVLRVAGESTFERIAALIKDAAEHKSKTEKIADRFAGIFLPVVFLIAAGTYYFTHDIVKTISIFLVACADDMAVAIPLAMAASIGRAARRGVIIKGGERVEALSKIDTIVMDKTGTLTYGHLAVRTMIAARGTKIEDLWRTVAIAEKYSEHPVGRALITASKEFVKSVPDPEHFELIKGHGLVVKSEGHTIVIGDPEIEKIFQLKIGAALQRQIDVERETAGSIFVVFVDGVAIGFGAMSDIPRASAAQSIREMRVAGAEQIIMLTGDNAVTAGRIAESLEITDVRADMKPDDKLRVLEELSQKHRVAMVGDGVNDAPALSRADVGIAMGAGGTAVAAEAADIVILTDELSRIPEMMDLSRRTMSVIKSDIVIWFFSNAVGFALVLTGIAGPALAAFYNFATDFLPLINSARLFRWKNTR